jgi:hypothetical protein
VSKPFTRKFYTSRSAGAFSNAAYIHQSGTARNAELNDMSFEIHIHEPDLPLAERERHIAAR